MDPANLHINLTYNILFRYATTVILVWNSYPKRVLKPIVNSTKILLEKYKGTQIISIKYGNVKRGWEEINFRHEDLSFCISRH